MPDVDPATLQKLEAEAFRKLLAHLKARTDVQNIDMMNLTGFCRNCLSRWLQEAAEAEGASMDKEQAREHVYGMPYEAWKKAHQTPASKETLTTFEQVRPRH